MRRYFSELIYSLVVGIAYGVFLLLVYGLTQLFIDLRLLTFYLVDLGPVMPI